MHDREADGAVRPWRRLAAERLQRCRVFDVDRVRFAPPDGRDPREYFVVEAPDWINVVPLTEDGRVVMIRQFRFGIDEVTLEIPGGMCDPSEAPLAAARRELREETGYDADDFVDLGWVHPNPAVQTNRCHTFLAERAARGAARSGRRRGVRGRGAAARRRPAADQGGRDHARARGGRVLSARTLRPPIASRASSRGSSPRARARAG